jgi:hypothetical protein
MHELEIPLRSPQLISFFNDYKDSKPHQATDNRGQEFLDLQQLFSDARREKAPRFKTTA